ncbi:N-acetyl-1-D-myo-inositol-2-amino-2-deoxy-alpha-D-glucopyranoside deacetylase [Streptomyces sp. 7-21]|jgi:N-acetyl-1-D-myo-inositol-2-amino-2-deoxy-alpha-D-glucopyranoside deacetylase|uniref:N-acetyl-1-D-myo-inositol-2-amino-2-deoxy-alpha- D-glucopyranoside deacetylase n=1 Tax=Streptomyces sp. 7-21 TaxID=2802283 RepID=UPI00191EC7C6|nr:N-acetyl-1-D-myo-inositol-2-amino-2-deoxy-alpha-D-glucopyranoside deacetylase [Streptomyces sp. 7-21]MBL1066276.1 N-acetyl-1-D-myo-inositol-2-amino-2-deoxy-alpha-D-glucopyranoside deacetylase [Streptomyces sp. 7-21]
MSSGQGGVLLVHAHPDDESICNGVTMAACVASGTPVTLVTCTLGEEGEIIPPDLAHLAAGRDDALGPYRAGELDAAMRELGVTDHRFLGGQGRWRDSGMAGVPQNDHPAAFCRADLDEAAAALGAVIDEVRPRVVITYGPDGGYGHPDHVKAHQVAMHAARDRGVPRVLWNCLPEPVATARLARLRAAGPGRFATVAGLGDLQGVLPEGAGGRVLAVEGTPQQVAAKARAMAAHATQIDVEPGPDGGTFALSNGIAQPLWGTEYYVCGAGEPLPPGARGVFDGLPDALPGSDGRGNDSGDGNGSGEAR